MQRALGNMETALHLTRRFAPMSVAGVLRLRGAPEADSVRDALAVLQRRHPLLRARIVTEGRKPTFEIAADVPAVPLDVVPRSDDTQWRDVVVDVLNRNVNIEVGPPLACTYLRDPAGSGGDLLFAYDHSIMDATSAVRLYDQLLRLCSGDSDSATTGDPAVSSLPPSIDELLPDRLTGLDRVRPLARFMRRQAADEFGYQRAIRGRAPTIHDDAACFVVTRSLGVQATNDMVSRARRRRLTVNSVLAASLVKATHQQLLDGESMPVRAIAFSDLRPSLDPSPRPEVLGCYISMLRYTLPLGANTELSQIAHMFQDQVRESIRQDEHLLASGLAKQLMKAMLSMKRMRMADTALSYAGPLQLQQRYGDIEVTDVHGFISNNRLGPLSTAFVTMFGGRLSWDFVFLDSDLDPSAADRLADTVVDLLSDELHP